MLVDSLNQEELVRQQKELDQIIKNCVQSKARAGIIKIWRPDNYRIKKSMEHELNKFSADKNELGEEQTLNLPCSSRDWKI
jgi:hypothetical protein